MIHRYPFTHNYKYFGYITLMTTHMSFSSISPLQFKCNSNKQKHNCKKISYRLTDAAVTRTRWRAARRGASPVALCHSTIDLALTRTQSVIERYNVITSSRQIVIRLFMIVTLRQAVQRYNAVTSSWRALIKLYDSNTFINYTPFSTCLQEGR